MQPFFNFRCRKVGGIWFVRLGRFGCSFYISRAFCCMEPERKFAHSVQHVTPDRSVMAARGE